MSGRSPADAADVDNADRAEGGRRPGRDRRAERIDAPVGNPQAVRTRRVVVIGGGIAGIAAATALAERGIAVELLERHHQLGGRVRSWPVGDGADAATMSRGFHAFFRQYYNLRSLLRRTDPELSRLRPIADYPLRLRGGHTDSFAGLPRTPPWNLAGFVIGSRSFGPRDLLRIDLGWALRLLDVNFPQTFGDYDGISAAEFLDRLRFPDRARHLALEVFARSFFADPADFAAGELVAMFHSYFIGSAEGLLFDVPDDDYNTALWDPMARHLRSLGVTIGTDTTVTGLDLGGSGVRITRRRRSAGRDVEDETVADAAVIAADPAGLRDLIGSTTGFDEDWRRRVGRITNAPPFAVQRLWLDRTVRPERPAFLGTSGYGPLDNISVLERFEAGSEQWAARHRGSVVELHAYALPAAPDGRLTATLQDQLCAALISNFPELAPARILHREWLVENDCPLIAPTPWADRPGVETPDPRLLLAGDTIRCDLPVALMERAATTGFQAANALLTGWRIRGHELWTVPRHGRYRWVGRIRRTDRRAAGRTQPGNSPRRRSSKRRSA